MRLILLDEFHLTLLVRDDLGDDQRQHLQSILATATFRVALRRALLRVVASHTDPVGVRIRVAR